MAAGRDCPVISADELPAGVLAAFWRYDNALLANDKTTLDELFADGDFTIRADATRTLLGKHAITNFRSGRSAIPTRRVVELQVRVLNAETVLVMARTREAATGATGLQTQLWQLLDGWQVTAAHVSLPITPAGTPFDRSIWRVLGDPLLRGTAVGPLSGLTVAVKDLFAVAGQRIGAGVPAWLAEQHPEEHSAPAVQSLLDAGADIIGIARTDEFAYSLAGANSHYGTPPNPALPGSISGGSTSGPASAVALGHADVGLGTDTAGSIRVPASYQGLVGLRTSHGLIDIAGVLALAPAFDTVSWVTRDLETARRLAPVLLGPTCESNAITAVFTSATLTGLLRPQVHEAFDSALTTFVAEAALHQPSELGLTAELLEAWFSAFRTLQGYQAWQGRGDWVSAHPGCLAVDVAARFASASTISAAEAAAASATVDTARAWLRQRLLGAVLVIASAAGAAPSRTATTAEVEAARDVTLHLTCLASLAGLPALSLPRITIETPAGPAPLGLCLIGAHGSDHQLLALAGLR